MKPLRILALAHPDLIPPDNVEGLTEAETYVWKTDNDVSTTLRASGHEVRMLGVQTELALARLEIDGADDRAVAHRVAVLEAAG